MTEANSSTATFSAGVAKGAQRIFFAPLPPPLAAPNGLFSNRMGREQDYTKHRQDTYIHTYGRTLRLLDQINPVGRFGENKDMNIEELIPLQPN